MDTSSVDTPALLAATTDSELRFVSNDGSKRLLKAIPVHACALAKASGYFSVLFNHRANSGGTSTGSGGTSTNSGGNRTSPGTNAAGHDDDDDDGDDAPHSPPAKKARGESSPLMSFVVEIADCCLSGAEALLESMYTGRFQLDPSLFSANPVGLLHTAVLADAWQLPPWCARECLSQLTCMVRGATLDLEEVVSTLPEAITSMPEFTELLEANYGPMLETFLRQAVTLVSCTGEPSRKFCALSPLLIKVWARSNPYVGSDEETVALLITRWWGAQSPAIQQDEDLCLALSNAIRIGCLSMTYLKDVLPVLPWFRGAGGEAYAEVLARKQTAAGRGAPSAQLPEGWAQVADAKSMSHEWQLDKLVMPLPARIDLPAKYAQGWLWSARIECAEGEDEAKIHLQVSSPLPGSTFLDVALRRMRAAVDLYLQDAAGNKLWQLRSKAYAECQPGCPVSTSILSSDWRQ